VSEPLLSVERLRVEFETDHGVVHAVDGVSYAISSGRTLAIVGESGAGKTVSARTLLGLTRGPATKISGRIMFGGGDLAALGEEGLRDLAGDVIAITTHDPLSGLDPLYRLGTQLTQAVRAHRGVSSAAARDRAIDLLELVGIPDPHRRIDAHPHELTPGLRRRAMLAVALANRPKVLIADDPTRGLDLTVQAQILALLEDLQDRLGMAMIFITRDLGVAAEIAHEVAVMYSGRIVELASTEEIFVSPQHPYTWGLLRSIPSLGRVDSGRAAYEELAPSPGSPPSPIDRPSGCHFHPRCPYAQDSHKRIDPQLRPVEGRTDHSVACLLPVSVRQRIWQGIEAGQDVPSLRDLASIVPEGQS
jgi:peptide/nickel transport system ATP-binding protein